MPRRIRWGVLSTAQIGRSKVIPAIRESTNGQVVAISSRDAERARQVAEELNIPRAHGSYQEVIDDPEVDAVYNPLPIALHAEWSIRCAEAQKPCLCEKPLATGADEASRMVDAFAERGVPFAEALMYRHHPLTRKVKQMVDEGMVGEVRTVQAVFCALCPGEYNIRWRPELGGGAMLDVGSYCVSVMRLVTGEEPVDATATAHFGNSGVDEWVAGTLTFPSGARGALVCGLGMEFGCSYDIYGTDGRIFVESGVVPGESKPATIRHWSEYELSETVIPPANHYRLMVEDFADALLNDRPPRFSPRDAVENLRAVDLIMNAAH